MSPRFPCGPDMLCSEQTAGKTSPDSGQSGWSGFLPLLKQLRSPIPQLFSVSVTISHAISGKVFFTISHLLTKNDLLQP